MCLMLQGLAFWDVGFTFVIWVSPLPAGCMNSHASQSSSAACDGSSQRVPKSSGVLTRPVPKYTCQIRFTNARAVVGDFGSTSHLAKVSRAASELDGSGCKNA